MENITFENWINELEGYSLRSERAYEELVDHKHNSTEEQWNNIYKWLKAAFKDGYSYGVESQNINSYRKINEQKT